jgi:hypothetical protein
MAVAKMLHEIALLDFLKSPANLKTGRAVCYASQRVSVLVTPLRSSTSNSVLLNRVMVDVMISPGVSVLSLSWFPVSVQVPRKPLLPDDVPSPL